MTPLIRNGRAATLAALLVHLFTTQSLAMDSAPEPVLHGIPTPLTLEWCLDRARAHNPSLAVAQAMADAASHRIRPAGAFDDPRIAYEASNIPVGDFDFDSTPLSGHQLGLRQKLPFPGFRSNREAAARKSAAAAALLAEDRSLVVDAAVEAAWAELGYAQQALGITNRNIELLRQLSATAESRYRVGSGLQQDVLRAQVELTVLLEERLQRNASIEAATAKLIALLDLPADVDLPPTDSLELNTVEPELPSLLSGLEERNPRLAASLERVEEARHEVRVSELEGLPDVDVGVGYRVRKNVVGDPVEGDDFVSAGFTIRLPGDRSKWRAKVAERRALLRSAEAGLREVRLTLASQVRSAHAELRRAAAEEALLESGLVPQARQSLEASRSAYEVGRIAFLSLLDSQIRLLQAELRLARARADKRVAFSSLETASGGKLR